MHGNNAGESSEITTQHDEEPPGSLKHRSSAEISRIPIAGLRTCESAMKHDAGSAFYKTSQIGRKCR